MDKHTEVLKFLTNLKKSGIFISLEGNDLEVEASDDLLTDEILSNLKSWKQDIVDYLQDKAHSIDFEYIKKADVKDYYPLSSAQKRLYILQEMDPDNVVYNVPTKISLGEDAELDRIENTFRTLINRHESFRTSFYMIDGEPVQKVHEIANLVIEQYDLDGDNIDDAFNKFTRPFDLSKAPLVRVGLAKWKNEFFLLYDLHHIITDGVSQNILQSEFVALYSGEELAPLKLQYKDFSEWQESCKHLGAIKRQKDYWKSVFADELPILELPTDYSRPSIQSFEGNNALFILDNELTTGLRKFSKSHKVTLFMSLVGVINVLLARLCGQEDIVIGVPTIGRRHHDLEKIIGMFVNTVPLRNFPKGDSTFIDFINEVKTRTIAAFDNQDFQFEDLVETVINKRDPSRNPVFDVMLSLESQDEFTGEVNADDGITFRETGISKFDMNWAVVDDGKQLCFHVEYCTALFTSKTIEKFISYFKAVTRSIIDKPDVRIRDIDLITSQERSLIKSFNNNHVHYKNNLTVFDYLEKYAASNSQKVAFICGQDKIEYKDLNGRVNQLSNYLIKKEVSNNRTVALLLERSIDMVVAILAIWKAGGAYVPIDINYPAKRIRTLIDDSEAVCVITKSRFKSTCLRSKIEATIVDLVEEVTEINLESFECPNLSFKPENLSYVIFTSGSTGKPKGAMINHDGMINHLHAKINDLSLNQDSVVAQTASHTFDISVWQFFAALMVGGSAIIVPDDIVLDTSYFLHALTVNEVSVVEVVPSHLTALLNQLEDSVCDLSKLKYLLVTGEVIQPSIVNQWLFHYPSIPIVNAYGPTEASDDITHHHMHEFVTTERVPIGRPIQNLEINIVDKYMNLCPLGVKGEIVVSGVGVGGGYLNNKDATQAAFIEDPFNPGLGRKMYKTGDLGKWLDDGTIDFFGRIDNQVKIRGFRIELGEIETKLLDISHIKEASVIEREDDAGKNYICGYFVAKNKIEITDIKNELLKVLPEYMVPSFFVKLEEMPLTANGKVNRKALPKPEIEMKEYVAPSGNVELLLQHLWSEVLNIEKSNVSVDENFFALGGNSIIAMKVINGVRKTFEIELTIKTIFEKSTITSLASVINKMRSGGEFDDKFDSLSQVDRCLLESYPTSPVQDAVWYLLELKPDSTFYNIDFVFDVRGDLKIDALLQAINILMAARDVFQIKFARVGDEVSQVYIGERIYKLEDIYTDLRVHGRELMEEDLGLLLNRQPDLSDPPIAEFRLFHMEEQYYKFVFVTSHIIWDQASSISFFEELSKLYNKISRGEDVVVRSLEWDYLDYCTWHRGLLENGKLEVSRQYWLKVFESIPKPLELPTDYIRPDIQTFAGGDEFLFLESEERRDVDRFCFENKITYQMFFLSVLNLWIYRMSGQNDFLVGTPMSSRVADVFDDSFGLFASALPIRCSMKRKWRFSSLLDHVKEVSLESYEHHLYPVSKVIGELETAREVANNQFIRVFFGVQNDETDLEEIVFDGLEVVPSGESVGIDSSGTSHFDFTFQIDYTKSSMRLRINYSKDLYRAESAQRQLAQLRSLAFQCIQNPEELLEKYSLGVGDDKEVLGRFVRNYVEGSEVKPTVFDLWSSAAEKFRQRPALRQAGSMLSYGELSEEVDVCAMALNAYGVRAGDRIGLIMRPSQEAIVSMLASLKIGAVYVPIGEKVPEQRLKAIVRQSKVKCLIRGVGLGDIRTSEKEIFDLIVDYEDLMDGDFDSNDKSSSRDRKNGDDTAYMIFTSGTTGIPKGMSIANKGVVNLIESSREYYKITDQDIALFHTPINFDASVLDVYLPLLSGGCVVVAEEEVYGSLVKLRETLIEKCITFVQFVPAMLDEFLYVCEFCDAKEVFRLRNVISGGAPLSRSVRDRFFRIFDCKLSNNYGPSEITVDATRFDCSQKFDGNIVPLGHPISNVDIYVLDCHGRLCPLGVVGEICISSIGMFKGYEGGNDSESSPFVLVDGFKKGSIRSFKTGDYGYYGVDGNLYFIGRKDGQIKVNGNRIEVDEVEAVLQSIDFVKNASVLALKGKGSNYSMVGFVELQNDRKIDLDVDVDAFTLEQNSVAKREMRFLHSQAWPCFFQGSAVVRGCWEDLLVLFPELQISLLDTDNKVAAVGNAVALNWSGLTNDLPKGWDELVLHGVNARKNQSQSIESPNTLVVLAAVTGKNSRGKGLSRKVIEVYRELAPALGYSKLLVALRPLGKEAFPSMSVQDYVDGHFEGTIERDFWIELHTKLGGRVIKCSTESQLVTGSFSDWQDWTGIDIESDDTAAVPGALANLVLDKERDSASYYDPCVWIEHSLKQLSVVPEYISMSEIRSVMADWLPSYAIPGRIVTVNTIPKFDSGKIDRRKLEIAGFESEQSILIKPTNALEEQVCECFARALEAPCLSVHQSFFESGGHSLSALKLVYGIESVFGISLSLSELFADPTPFRIAELISSKQMESSQVVF